MAGRSFLGRRSPDETRVKDALPTDPRPGGSFRSPATVRCACRSEPARVDVTRSRSRDDPGSLDARGRHLKDTHGLSGRPGAFDTRRRHLHDPERGPLVDPGALHAGGGHDERREVARDRAGDRRDHRPVPRGVRRGRRDGRSHHDEPRDEGRGCHDDDREREERHVGPPRCERMTVDRHGAVPLGPRLLSSPSSGRLPGV